MKTKTAKLSQTALRILDRAACDERNNEPRDERCPIHTFGRGGEKAVETLLELGLGSVFVDDVETRRFIISPAGVEHARTLAASIDSATDPLNIRGATCHY